MASRVRYKDLELTPLRSFCLVAREGNFSKAAKALRLSTSAVWQQVRSLERTLKAPLLQRRGRLVELTEEGPVFNKVLVIIAENDFCTA